MPCALKAAGSFRGGRKKVHIIMQISLSQQRCKGAKTVTWVIFILHFLTFKIWFCNVIIFFLSHSDYRNLEFFKKGNLKAKDHLVASPGLRSGSSADPPINLCYISYESLSQKSFQRMENVENTGFLSYFW